MTLGEIGEILQAKPIVEGSSQAWEIEIDRVYACDLMSDVLAFIEPGSLLLTGLTNCHVIRTVEMADITSVCFVRDKQPGDEILKLATEKHVALLSTPLSMYEACGRLYATGLGVPPDSK